MKGLVSIIDIRPHTAGAPTSQSTSSINVFSTSRITQEQEERGRRGEQEIKRRLQLPGGWMGFSLFEGKRQSGCGYDFYVILMVAK